MCLVSFEGFVATKTQRVQFKSFRASVDGKVQCDPQLFSQHSFVVCELMKCAFLSKMHFCTFYHRDCIGLHDFCDSCELSRHPLC